MQEGMLPSIELATSMQLGGSLVTTATVVRAGERPPGCEKLSQLWSKSSVHEWPSEAAWAHVGQATD